MVGVDRQAAIVQIAQQRRPTRQRSTRPLRPAWSRDASAPRDAVSRSCKCARIGRDSACAQCATRLVRQRCRAIFHVVQLPDRRQRFVQQRMTGGAQRLVELPPRMRPTAHVRQAALRPLRTAMRRPSSRRFADSLDSSPESRAGRRGRATFESRTPHSGCSRSPAKPQK